MDKPQMNSDDLTLAAETLPVIQFNVFGPCKSPSLKDIVFDIHILLYLLMITLDPVPTHLGLND